MKLLIIALITFLAKKGFIEIPDFKSTYIVLKIPLNIGVKWGVNVKENFFLVWLSISC